MIVFQAIHVSSDKQLDKGINQLRDPPLQLDRMIAICVDFAKNNKYPQFFDKI